MCRIIALIKKYLRARKMAQQLKSVAALVEDLGLMPTSPMAAHQYPQPRFQGSCSLLTTKGTCKHEIGTNACK